MSVMDPVAVVEAPEDLSLQRRGMHPAVRWLLLVLIAAGYALIAAGVAFFAARSGNYLDGVDAMFYVHRGDFLYKSITQEGNWFPILDMAWYNSVETWRYWSPLPAYILAGCQALRGGSVNDGFLLFSAILCFLDGIVWLHIGRTHGRPWLGAILGALWFFVPNTTAQMLFSEGVLARAITMPVMPLLFVYVHDYFNEPKKRWSSLPKIILCFLWLLWCHIGWGGMAAITLLIYLFFYFLCHLQKMDRVPMAPLAVCVVLAFLLDGIALLPSLRGGITGIDSSAVMAHYFQSFLLSVNPFYFVKEGFWNRWVYAETGYYGLTALVFTVLGILCARRDATPGFCTALSILLLSTPTSYEILVHLPGSQFLWMSRFLSIALCLFAVSLFFWRSLKKWVLGIGLAFFAVEVLCLVVLVTQSSNPMSPDSYHNYLDKSMLIDQAREVTHQRMSIVDPYDTEIDGIYVVSSFGQDPKPTSFGQGVQAAVQYTNLVNLNQAAEDEYYLYLFDRLMELGNDTVIVPLELQSGRSGANLRDVEAMEEAAAQVGYVRFAENDKYLAYHLAAAPAGNFGLVSKYRAAAIGTGSSAITVGFPAVEELEDVYLDHYTYEQLEHYDVIYLAGFMYEDKHTAEQLVLDLSEKGTRWLIMADGMPDDEHTSSKTFLGVSCNRVNFQNGYPALETIDGVLYCDLFPDGYAKDWKTVYVNGLDQVWGTITDVPEGQMDFYGTAHNDNIVFIGLALTYHYALTKDAAVGNLLSHALTLSPRELPQREIVPIGVDYRCNVLTVDSPKDNVNTTISFHEDVFRPDRPLHRSNNLTVVDQGRTVIRLSYPLLAPGLALTGLGVVLTGVYLFLMKRRFKKLAEYVREHAPETVQAQVDAKAAKEAEMARREAERQAAQEAHDRDDEELARQEAEAKTAKLRQEAAEKDSPKE